MSDYRSDSERAQDLRDKPAQVVAYCPQNPEQHMECEIETCPCCGGLGVAAKCMSCNGTGAIYIRTLREAQLAHSSQWEKCEVCKGRGWWPISTALFDRLGFSHRMPPRRSTG